MTIIDRRRFYYTFCLLVTAGCISTLALACKDAIQDPDESDIVFPDSAVSFTRHVEPLLQQRCAFIGCHAGSLPAAELDLSTPSYQSLKNHLPILIIAGEPDNSLLVQRITGAFPPRMPLNRQSLTQNQINGIKQWIREGAVLN